MILNRQLVSSNIYGVEASKAALRRYKKEIGVATERGAFFAASHLLKKTLPHVPLRPGPNGGELRRSGKVTTRGRGVNAQSIVSFNTGYAVMQHEDMTYYHPTPGTYAKYLERTAHEEMGRMQVIMYDEMVKAGVRAINQYGTGVNFQVTETESPAYG